MTKPDESPEHSPLAQSVTREGKTVRVEIYEDGEGGWLLAVVDDYGNSTVWDDPFPSDGAALEEALKAIDEEGIDSLIGSPPDGNQRVETSLELSEDELNELDDFLSDEVIQDTSMDVSTLEGFLTAIAMSPDPVLPSQWLPWVWDMDDGEVEVEFEDDVQASRILSLIMRHYNAIIQTFTTDPASFDPIFWRGNQWGAAEWCEGFLLGFQFNDEAWALLSAAQPKWFAPFMLLGTDEGLDITRSKGDAEHWMNEIEVSLLKINAYWTERRPTQAGGLVRDDSYLGEKKGPMQIVRGSPKIGRNDSCPCGSGEKFKKCCGAGGTPPTVH